MVGEDGADADMPKQKILLRRRAMPQWMWLPNGQSFLAKYKKRGNNRDKTNWG